MKTDIAAIASFLENVCRTSNHRTAQFWRGYWFDTGHYRRLLQVLEKLDPVLQSKPRLLDIGSFGEFPLILLKFYGLPVVYANSLEGDFIACGKGKLLQTGDPDIEIAFVIEQRDVERRPLSQSKESLDVVTCFEILEHLRFDPMFMMLEIHRVLREGGLLILSTPNASSWESLARVGAFESPFIFSSYFADGSGIGHCKEYSVSEIRQLVDNAGFTVEKIETFDSVQPDPVLESNLKEVKEHLRAREWWKEELRGQTFLIQARKTGQPKMRKYTPLYTENVPYLLTPAGIEETDRARLKELLARRELRVQELEMEAKELRDHVTRLQAEFEERSRWALELDKEVGGRREHISKLQREFDERGKWALELDREVHSQREIIDGLQRKLANLEALLGSRHFLFRKLMQKLW